MRKWTFKKQTFKWKGVEYCADVVVEAYAERRFKASVKFGDDSVLTNFAAFVRVEYSFTNVCRIEGGKKVKVADFTDGYWLPVKLVGVFIAPTIQDFARLFKPATFAAFEQAFVNGLTKLPMGHPK